MNIYAEQILEHYHDPCNQGVLKAPTHEHSALNPTCGDKITMQLRVTDKSHLKDIAFSGEGCAISQAAASMLTEAVKDQDVSLLKNFSKDDMLGILGVELSPNRLKCGLLGLESAQKALQKTKQ